MSVSEFAFAGQRTQALGAARIYENNLVAKYCPKYESFSRNFLIETNTIAGRSI